MTAVSEISNLKVSLPERQLSEVCQRFGVQELAVFGSILTDRFSPESDVDFLVVFQNDDYGPWACKLTQLQNSLAALLGRNVDVVSRRAVALDPNYIRRERILSTARTVYVD